MLRYLLWRLLGAVAIVTGVALVEWLLRGGPGRALRGGAIHGLDPTAIVSGDVGAVVGSASAGMRACLWLLTSPGGPLVASCGIGAVAMGLARLQARRRRRYVRLRVQAYRGDHADVRTLETMLAVLHKRLLVRWWRRLLHGQPSLALEVHRSGASCEGIWLALSCLAGHERMLEAAVQAAYPNCRLLPADRALGRPPVVLRLKKHAEFTARVRALVDFERRPHAPIDRLVTVMTACGEPAVVQIAAAPTPAFFEGLARHLYRRQEGRFSRERHRHLEVRDRSLVEDAELRGGLDLQHRPLFFADLRVVGLRRATCERIATELRADNAENRLVERGTAVRHGLLGLYTRRVQRGESNPLPGLRKGVYSAGELATMWQLPSPDYLGAPFARSGVPRAPASPAVLRPTGGQGTLRDALGPVSIHQALRRQNVAVPGTVEQGKSSFLVASVAEDLLRERCAVIVLDPKGDAADAALSVVPPERACTLLDLSHPTCGFNPLAVQAPADVIADYVVGALKGLFTDADIRASSDRYLRNAIIAVLAYDRQGTLWDAARLLSVGEEGYAYRSRVASRVRALPEFKEISEFFAAELSAQLADARATTTAKLDAPVNKLARLLNSPSIKRVLLNDSLHVDFDRVIAGAEVLVVKGALGAMGAGNTAVLMQLLVGMLDAALARQQDLVAAEQRVAVALKVDEAPLVINRGFAETMALKRSAGLETVACWQTDAQWSEREIRDQLDALFAHRVYFATASALDARAAARLTMAEFSDSVRPDMERLSSLGRPDVRLHLPRHHAIASWVTHEGRQPAFVAQTIPLQVDPQRLAAHAARQHERGGRHMADLVQPHWDRPRPAGPRGANDSGVARVDGVIREAPARAADGNDAAKAAKVSADLAPESTRGGDSAGARAPGEGARDTSLRSVAAESYRELVDLDRAHSVRHSRPPVNVQPLDPEPLDLEMLALIEAAGHVLTTQLHRRFNPSRAVTTTQRRLKRLSDAGLVERFQFHRRDGGGVPMCYRLAPAGVRLLAERTGVSHADGPHDGAGVRAAGHSELRQARHEVHVVGWALALVAALGHERVSLHAREQSVVSPEARRAASGTAPLGPAELRLPGGRTPHDFLRTIGERERGEPQRAEVERFETLRPDLVLAVGGVSQAQHTELFLERDDRPPVGVAARKLERYDHFLSGWSAHIRRYRDGEALPVVVFICRDRTRARECARAADRVLGACRAYPGEYPHDWLYPGRERIVFVSERDMHEGLLNAYAVSRLPPQVRVGAAHGDPRAAESTAASVEIPGLERGAAGAR